MIFVSAETAICIMRLKYVIIIAALMQSFHSVPSFGTDNELSFILNVIALLYKLLVNKPS